MFNLEIDMKKQYLTVGDVTKLDGKWVEVEVHGRKFLNPEILKDQNNGKRYVKRDLQSN